MRLVHEGDDEPSVPDTVGGSSTVRRSVKFFLSIGPTWKSLTKATDATMLAPTWEACVSMGAVDGTLSHHATTQLVENEVESAVDVNACNGVDRKGAMPQLTVSVHQDHRDERDS